MEDLCLFKIGVICISGLCHPGQKTKLFESELYFEMARSKQKQSVGRPAATDGHGGKAHLHGAGRIRA